MKTIFGENIRKLRFKKNFISAQLEPKLEIDLREY